MRNADSAGTSAERQHLLRHPLANLVRVIARLDPEVRLQQVNDREVGRLLPVGSRPADQDQRAPAAVRLDEFPEETRLADARLADDGHDLAVTRLGPLERLGKLVNLLAPSHERREPLAQP